MPRDVAAGPVVSVAGFAGWFRERSDAFLAELLELVQIPTVSPHEDRCHPWLRERLEDLGATTRQQFPAPMLRRHTAFTRWDDAERPLSPNLRSHLPASGCSRLLISAHVDVVPEAPGQQARLIRDGVAGRGAVDNKNNILMTLIALRYLRDLGIPLAYELMLDFVVEEEVGGAGALSSILEGCPAQEVIVLEPTSLVVYPGHRGCVSFEVAVRGDGAHMGGDAHDSLNAITGAAEVVTTLKRLEDEMTRLARASTAFGGWNRPTPLNVGSIAGGQWHGSVPESCVLRGNLGFLPADGLEGACARLHRALQELAEPLRSRVELTFNGLHNGAYLGDLEAPLARALTQTLTEQDIEAPPLRGWSASCDARLYAELTGADTMIFGCGRLELAHGRREQILAAELADGARVLAAFLSKPRH